MKVPLNATRKTLLLARQEYSRCAAIVEKRITAQGLTPILSEQMVGVGVAAEWLRRAWEMESITYVGTKLNESRRREPFVELLRYGFAWFGLNAIFSRPAVLGLVGTPANHRSELEHFRVLFNAGPVTGAVAKTAMLHSILATPTDTRLPNLPAGTQVPTLFAIDTKYIPGTTKHAPTAKAVAAAAIAGTPATLDLATLLYAFRNWAVHGNVLDGGFGSKPRFLGYVGILTEVLAEVHVNAAAKLRSKL